MCHSCLKKINQSYLIQGRRIEIIDLILILYYFYNTMHKIAIRLSTSRIFIFLSKILSERKQLLNYLINLAIIIVFV